MIYNEAEGDVVFSYISSVKLFVPPAYNLPYCCVERCKDRVLHRGKQILNARPAAYTVRIDIKSI
jgi:hypothetical protein